MQDPAFKEAIWTALGQVPAGRVISYGGLARMAGFAGRSRQVGTSLKGLPAGTSLPWHRVVNAQRQLSFPRNSPKYREQKQRLLAEGIVFRGYRILPEFFLE